ncbi:MAG: diaminopimelate decarboxylase [Verrucomicrobiales bacterium]|nr:diaminopimelate decarboxylase [Verrucomicrobiales bacterium]
MQTPAHAAASDLNLLETLAAEYGTPFWIWDSSVLRARIDAVVSTTEAEGVQARFAMKASPATKVLKEIKKAGVWIDSVSGNEVLRARHSGFSGGNTPPEICFTADVFRDNALATVLEEGVLPNVGSPGMVADLQKAGYTGPISLRVNPGFGHGHVNECDTGGPSSKHGVWITEANTVREAAEAAGMKVVMLHAHIGSGPQFDELIDNLSHLADEFAKIIPQFKDVEAVSLGGGIPHDYRNPEADVPVERLGDLFAESQRKLSKVAGRELRLEIEPGRFYVAPAAILVTRVTDVKETETNKKGPGVTFAMVDAGFVDLARPAMYGSFHRITLPGAKGRESKPVVVAGPLCESGDVFTRDDSEMLQPRELPSPQTGDLMLLHDGGAYGYSMASNYNSLGRAPQLWLENGEVTPFTRRETIEDILRLEVS